LNLLLVFWTIQGRALPSPARLSSVARITGRNQSMGRIPVHSMNLLASVVEDGRTYKDVAADLGVSRSTVERRIKGLLRRLHQSQALRSVRADYLDNLSAIRQERETIMAAARAYDEDKLPPPCCVVLDAKEVAAGARRLRASCRSANRDIALIYTLLCTGLKTMELARLEVGDYLDEQGDVRRRSMLRADAAANGIERPLFFGSAKAVESIDNYLEERIRRRLGVGVPNRFRGLDPTSRLFLTEEGNPFRVMPRSATDPRLTSKYLQATLRLAFARAGWIGMTAQQVRRQVALAMERHGADRAQLQELLGLRSSRQVHRLTSLPPVPLEEIARELV
jgi:integrase